MAFINKIKRFIRDGRGSVTMMGGLIFPVLATGIMASVEFNALQADKSKVQSQIDSTALAAANNEAFLNADGSDDLQAATRELMLEAIAASGLDLNNVTTSFVYDAVRDRIVGEVRYSPKAKFLGSFFLPDIVLVTTESAPLTPKEVEISLVLDVSGSMNYSTVSNDVAPAGSRRIDALRDGVSALIDALDEEENIEAKYAVVPYAASVDLTNLAVSNGWLANSYYSNITGDGLPDLCVRQTFANGVPATCLGTGDNNTKDPSGSSQTGLWAAERYVSKVNDVFNLSLAAPSVLNPVPVVTQGTRKDYCDFSYIAAFGSFCIEGAVNPVNGQIVLEKNRFSTRSGLLSMTEEVDDVQEFMDDLEANGGTAGHIGTVWGLYALTPAWGSVFNHPAGQPASFDDPDSNKIMIVMTDGDFTVSQDPDITAEDETYDYFQATCALAREQGIEIYTVGLRASQNTNEQLTECAGSSTRYYSVNNRNQLIRAFERIADSATQVRISG